MIIIRLDWPDSRLLPNRANGKHWGGLAAIKSKAKGDAYTLTKNALKGLKSPWPEFKGDIPVSLLFMQPDGRRRDVDGMLSSAKHQIDGVCAALGIDDSRLRPLWIDRQRSPAKGTGALFVAVGLQSMSGTEIVDGWPV